MEKVVCRSSEATACAESFGGASASRGRGNGFRELFVPGPGKDRFTFDIDTVFTGFRQNIPGKFRLFIFRSVSEVSFRRPHMCGVGHWEFMCFGNSERTVRQFTPLFCVESVASRDRGAHSGIFYRWLYFDSVFNPGFVYRRR